MKDYAIQAIDLTKAFPGGAVAVSGLDLQVERGAVFGLMGRNGAGKTTALRLLMGLLRPDHGTALLLGSNLWNAPRGSRSRIAYVSQTEQLPSWMTLGELCRYVSHFYERWNQDVITDLARRWLLPWNRAVGRLSNGEQRKAAIALALAPQPEVLLLDEPAAGLDPIARRELVEELVSVISRGEGCTVLFSTHVTADVERIAECIGFMDRGRLLLSARLDELQASTRRVQIIFPGDSPPQNLSIPGATRTETAGPVVTAITRHADHQYFESLKTRPGVRVQIFPMSLEEIFIEVVGQNTREDFEAARVE
ncbi:MAG: ABC transporter ATP-binding protein [Verrucomicrobia bacterium]|nr:ABC transporter ATP-binding protein [Verrucomicrobiota bacterium]